MKFEFTTNDLTVKNNPSLKRRKQFEVVMEVERALLASVVGLEAWPEGTHFKVVVEPLDPVEQQREDFKSLAELPAKKETLTGQNSIYVRFKRFCEERGVNYEKQKEGLKVEHLKDLEKLHTLPEVEKLLNERMNEIDEKLGAFSYPKI